MLAAMADLTHIRVHVFDMRGMLGARVRELRVLKHWDQRRLASEAVVSPSYVSKLERGEVANPKVLDIESIAIALGTTAADLLRQPVGTRTDRYSTVCGELVQQLESESPEIAEAILQAWRQSVEIARIRHATQNN